MYIACCSYQKDSRCKAWEPSKSNVKVYEERQGRGRLSEFNANRLVSFRVNIKQPCLSTKPPCSAIQLSYQPVSGECCLPDVFSSLPAFHGCHLHCHQHGTNFNSLHLDSSVNCCLPTPRKNLQFLVLKPVNLWRINLWVFWLLHCTLLPKPLFRHIQTYIVLTYQQ
jgi:hypothetical protein